eukprot:1431718-Rhodomonas_salina.2
MAWTRVRPAPPRHAAVRSVLHVTRFSHPLASALHCGLLVLCPPPRASSSGTRVGSPRSLALSSQEIKMAKLRAVDAGLPPFMPALLPLMPAQPPFMPALLGFAEDKTPDMASTCRQRSESPRCR